jgi:hypothetical protein
MNRENLFDAKDRLAKINNSKGDGKLGKDGPLPAPTPEPEDLKDLE